MNLITDVKALFKRAARRLPVVRDYAAERDGLRAEAARLRAAHDRLREEHGAARAEADRLRAEIGARKPIRPEVGTVHPFELDLLRRLVAETDHLPGPIVEVGTLLGVTTTRLALWKAPGRKIVTVDNYSWNPWGLAPDEHLAVASQVLGYLVRTGHVEQVVADKGAFFRVYDQGPPSLVFLDAVHNYEQTKADLDWARRVGAAAVAGHDYNHLHPEVVRAVDEAGGPRRLCGSVFCL
jgi:predicted O-methyltransferase YrrM